MCWYGIIRIFTFVNLVLWNKALVSNLGSSDLYGLNNQNLTKVLPNQTSCTAHSVHCRKRRQGDRYVSRCSLTSGYVLIQYVFLLPLWLNEAIWQQCKGRETVCGTFYRRNITRDSRRPTQNSLVSASHYDWTGRTMQSPIWFAPPSTSAPWQ